MAISSSPTATDAEPTLLAQLLAAQHPPTLVERFAERHADGNLPAGAARHRELIPLSAPGPGEQYGFVVDLDACTGCRACVTACHSLNGLDDTETWRSVGMLIGGSAERPVRQTVTTSCHHCADPGCLRGCPVGAYEKDGVTGIVRHLDDQCIGCGYCVLMCPYEVPQYSASRGIVRKCDMCQSRLAAGEPPACVQACPSQAITIDLVRRDGSGSFPPDTPAPEHTRPTTRYVSARGVPAELTAADRYRLAPAPGHAPLVVMLTLTELAVGLFVALAVGDGLLDASVRRQLATGALTALLTGLAASVLHLGQPAKAWRAFLGVRTSWMSREIVAFGAVVLLAVAFVGSLWVGCQVPGLAAGVAMTGIASVSCSVMIYHATGRAFWHVTRTGPQLFGATALFGTTGLLAGAVASGASSHMVSVLVALVATVSIGKLLAGSALVRHRSTPDWTALRRSGQLLTGQLRPVTVSRGIAGALGGMLLPAGLLAASDQVSVALTALAVILAGELAERWLFFAAVAPARMPGEV